MKTTVKITVAVLLIIAALLSFFMIGKQAADIETYAKTVESIDSKKATVAGITAASATISTALAAVPGDMTTPAANLIMEISAYLAIVVCFLVLEKSLLTILGSLAFKILIPVAMAIFVGSVFWKRENLIRIGAKLLALAIVLATVVPLGVWLGDSICETHNHTIEQVETFDPETIQEDLQEETAEKEGKKFKVNINLKEKVTDKLAAVKEKVEEILNNFIDTVAVFLIAYCAMPVLTAVFLLWFVKTLFGLPIVMPKFKRIRPDLGKVKDMLEDCELAEVLE